MSKPEKYLLGVSGGPDSMALLELMRREEVVGAVAHVNYHHRPTADRDEKIVLDYCTEYKIPFYKMDVRKTKGNFQDYARVVRYRFFQKIVKKMNLAGVMVAHHFDDLLETYLLQKRRGSIPSFYGLKSETVIEGIKVVRPLLSYTKKELEQYCLDNNIAYGMDESNRSDDYARNRIRHSIIEKMSDEDKTHLKEEIDFLNLQKEEEKKKVLQYLKGKKELEVECYKNCTFKVLLLRYLLDEKISEAHLQELVRQLEKAKNMAVLIGDTYLVKEYGKIEVFPVLKDYAYTLKSYRYLKKEHFIFSKKGTSLDGVTLYDEDYPLVIRNVKQGDAIEMRFGTKKLNRFFIDRKIPLKERLCYPVVVNAKGKIILVPGLGCDRNHYSQKSSAFCVRIK